MIKILIMKFEQLKALVAVAEAKNFRDAAETLKLSQATITNYLSELQSQYSSPLFVLEGKKKLLTPFGQALVDAAKKQMSVFDLALAEVERSFTDDFSTPLRVGCRPEVFSHLAAKLPEKFSYHLISMAGPEVAPAILSGEIDFGFSHALIDSHQLLAKKAFKSHMRFICHKKLIPRGLSEPWKDEDFLKNQPALSYGGDGHLLDRICATKKLGLDDLYIRFTADNWRVLADLLNAGEGYGIIPDYIHVNEELFDVPLPSSISPHMDFYILMRAAYRNVNFFKEVLKVSWT